MAKAVKLSDIASKFNISTVTVSKALSGQKGVSEELRAKIVKLAEEMNYQQPSSVKRASSAEGYNLGVIISEIFLDTFQSFYWKLYHQIATHAVEKDCFTLLEVITKEDEQSLVMPKLAKEQKTDAILVIGKLKQEYLDQLEENCSNPILYVDYYNDKENCDAIISNSFLGAYRLTNHLFDMGHKKIAYVGSIFATDSIMDRYLGYVKSMLMHGCEINEKYIIEDRRRGAARIEINTADVIQADMPTAFVCNSDYTASYVIKILQEQGYRVPSDVSVVGFDNYLNPDLCEIDITSYEVDFNGMAKEAIYNIRKKIKNPSYRPGVIIVPGRLIHKNSVKKREENQW